MTATTTRTSRPTRARRVNPDTVAETEEAPFEVEEEEKPARRTRASKSTEKEEEQPTRRKRSAKAVERDDTDDDSDDEETVIPTFTGRAAILKARPQVDSVFFSWGEDDDDEPQIVKFLDVEPWSYNQHWVQRQGRTSFPCMGKDCPLCGIAQKTSQRIVYNVLNLSMDEPTVQALVVGVTIDDDLSAYDADKKVGPLPKLWWALSRQKLAKPKGLQKYKYLYTPIKDRDLEEDYGFSLDDAEDALEGAEALDREKVTGKGSRRILQEIADELMD